MNSDTRSLVRFVVSNAPYAVIPAMWFSYLADASLWWGAAIGIGMLTFLGVSARLVRSAKVKE